MTTPNTGQSGGDQPLARTASQVAEEASRTAESQASQTMDRAADTVDQVGQAVRQMSDSLREQQPQVASFAVMAADRIDQTGRYLRDHEPAEVVRSLEAWARRQPALAIGGALIAGIAAGRFLRAAAPMDGSGSRFSAGYGAGSSPGSSYADRSYGYGYGDGASRSDDGLGGTDSGLGFGGAYGAAGVATGAGGAITDDDSLALPADDEVVADVIPDSAVDELSGDPVTGTPVGTSTEGR